jgi:hypothetical protein
MEKGSCPLSRGGRSRVSLRIGFVFIDFDRDQTSYYLSFLRIVTYVQGNAGHFLLTFIHHVDAGDLCFTPYRGIFRR